jgi:glycosyltransferase involved in cell wall biosynthesis
MQKHRILFLTLKTFSATGGIEKVCKVAGKALYELEGENVKIFSMYDRTKSVDTKYFPPSVFTGFGAQKLKTLFTSISQGIKSKIVILSHINLLPIAFLIKKLSPKTKLVLFAHGVEVWQPLSRIKLKMLDQLDLIIAVSNYTKDKIVNLHNHKHIKCKVLNNCLDPFLSETVNTEERSNLYKKYDLSRDNFIMITVTRIAADEQYKGHDKVIESMSDIIDEFPDLRYIIAGKYDLLEKERLDKLIADHNLKDKIIFTGFVPDESLAAHYKIADLYVMPSKGEGFGIVFIEAMFFGLPVIAGNEDGSVDPLCNGELGSLVDPDDVNEVANAIKKVITDRSSFKPNGNLLMQKFSYPVYKKNLEETLKSLYN